MHTTEAKCTFFEIVGTGIAASFVHNEPTHLATLQEAKIPDAFYDSLEGQMPASIDVLTAIPHAIEAFCLNQVGIDQLKSRNLITAYFDIYLSPPHIDLLRDRDSAVVLGGNVDELVRHQSSLREGVMSNIMRIFDELKKRGQEFVQPEGEAGYGLLPAKKGDDAMTIEENSAEETQSAKDRKAEKKKAEEDGEKENEVTMAIDVFGRVSFEVQQLCFSIDADDSSTSRSSSKVFSKTLVTVKITLLKRRLSLSSSTFSTCLVLPLSCKETGDTDRLSLSSESLPKSRHPMRSPLSSRELPYGWTRPSGSGIGKKVSRNQL